MSEIHKLKTPLSDEALEELRSGDRVYLSGIIYTARDTAHKRMIGLMNEGKELPFDIRGQVIYYAGPTPARPGRVIGSAGPTTSYRMDQYAPRLIEMGLKGMIGKGGRSDEVISAMKRYKAVYFGVTGGAGALISSAVKSSEISAYEDLGPEAVMKLYIENMQLFVVNDILGNDLYIEGIKEYRKLY